MTQQDKQEEKELTVVVSGEAVMIRANTNQQIAVIIKQALREAEQTARPAGDWQLRAGEGEGAQLLDPKNKLRDYAIGLPATLFLSLRTGGGGNG